MKPLPTQDTLREQFTYDPDTGSFARIGNTPGRRANLNEISYNRYRRVRVNNVQHTIHRLIWVWMTGDDPGVLEVDHINNNKQDNRWVNLRLVTHEENQLNRCDTKANGREHSDTPRRRKARKEAQRRA